jgi:hypothetical protein
MPAAPNKTTVKPGKSQSKEMKVESCKQLWLGGGCTHQRNGEERIGECEKCGGPTPYCLKCDLCYCEWCEVA